MKPRYHMGVDMCAEPERCALTIVEQKPDGTQEVIKTLITGNTIEEDFDFWVEYHGALGNPDFRVIQEGPPRPI